jgi:hypothetical protein
MVPTLEPRVFFGRHSHCVAGVEGTRRPRSAAGPTSSTPGKQIMHSFRIGKLFGIEIRVDGSWLFIFVLLTWNLTTVFSSWHPGWLLEESFAVALAGSRFVFGCIQLQ